MRILKRTILLSVALLAAALNCGTDARAQAPASSVALGADRLFLGFIEDTALVNKQWWEGQVDYADGDNLDQTHLRLVTAFRPVSRLEIGGTLAYGWSSNSGPLPSGSGLSDMNVWGKWNFGTVGGATEFGAGGIVTVPTGDDGVGLGYDAFALEGFGALRHRVNDWILSARVGLQFNADGRIFGTDLDGKTSAVIGAGALWGVSTRVSLVGELGIRTERFENTDSDARILAGINWRPANQGVVRGAIAIGLTDGAPNFQVLGGYAYTF